MIRKPQEGCGGLGGEILERSLRQGRFSSSRVLARKCPNLGRERKRERDRERERESEREREREIYIYIYMLCYIAVKLLSGPSLALLEVIIWSKFVFPKHRLPKNTIKIGVSALFFWKKLRATILEVIIWSKLAFFKTQSTWTR